MQIAILGPLEVRDDAGRPIEIAGPRLRTLLTRLALDAGRPVGVATLVDAVWGDRPPAEETNALQTLVSRLRRAFGDTGVIVASQAGYRLAVAPEDVDAHRFEQLAADGASALRGGRYREAGQLLAEALGLWRGPALADTPDGAFAVPAARLQDLRLAALLDRVDADLVLADPTSLVPELEALALEHPLHERLAALLMRALGASGRPAQALRVYERLRTRLADELGADPSAQLQELHLSLLRGELAGETPALPRAGRRTNLSAQLTSFVGRDDEVARIGKSLEQYRLVTLVGPGGAGKTRLAGEAAGRIVDTTPDGVWLVELAQVTTGNDVAQAVLNSLGLRETVLLDRRNATSARDTMSRLVEGLADKQLLIVLDNCEHVIEASARLADQLLAACPELRVLATSREPLGIFGETLLAVPPLGQPAATASAGEALEYPAVRLFADRAAAVRPDFRVDDATVGTVVEIVRRLDGLPLAIELAAARLRNLPLTEIAERLSDRFRLLTGGSRTALPRHRTLRAVVEWSWGLLREDERRLVEQLSVFPSGITVESATAVGDVPAVEVSDLLASLVDKSLLHPLDGGHRLRMLETIREYGAERLAERGELAEARRRHAAHFAAVMAQAQPHLTTAGQLPWFALLAAERENLLAALRCLCDAGDADGALQLAVSLSGHAMMLGQHTDISTWMADALAVPGGRDPDLRLAARGLYALNAAATSTSGDVPVEDLKALAQELGRLGDDLAPMVGLLRAAVAFFADEPELVTAYVERTLAAPDPWARAAVRMFRGSLAENLGDVDAMREDIETALSEFEELGERWGLASTLRGRAQLLTLDGRLTEAEGAYEQALRLAGEISSSEDEGFLYGKLADLALRRGDIAAARRYMRQARSRADEHGAPLEGVFTLALLAAVEQHAGNLDEARALHAEAMRRVDVLPREHMAYQHVRAILLAVGAGIAYRSGDLDAAWEHARGSYEAAVGTRDLPIVAAVSVGIAGLTRVSDPETAAQMLGAAAQVRGADDPTDRDIVRLTGHLVEQLGQERFDELYAQGKSLDRQQAIERLAPPP